MALCFHYRAETKAPLRVALFPGAYNPPTIAHEAIAKAALRWADEVVWLIPAAFPHKPFEHTTLEQRLGFLQTLARQQPGFSVATSAGGLYAEIGSEAAAFYGPSIDIALVCGRDAAHRIATWDYGDPGFYERMLQTYRLLVAARHGDFDAGENRGERVISLEMPCNFDDVSSSLVRERMQLGEDWRSLVPRSIADDVAALYSTASRRPERDTD